MFGPVAVIVDASEAQGELRDTVNSLRFANQLSRIFCNCAALRQYNRDLITDMTHDFCGQRRMTRLDPEFGRRIRAGRSEYGLSPEPAGRR